MTTPRIYRRPPGSPFKPPKTVPVEVFEVGDRVTHDRCGLGRVVELEGEAAVHVDFNGRTVRVVAPYADMTKL
jgi:hypothetical protein